MLVVEVGCLLGSVYIIGRNTEVDKTPNAIEHRCPERSSVSALAASDAVSLSLWGHDIVPACAKIGRQARRLIQGVVGKYWRALPLQIV